MMEERFPIGEAAKRTGLSVKAIRYYADQGIVPPAAVSDAGYRLYSLEDLWRLGLVRILRQLEFGLPEIHMILAGSRDIQSVVHVQREALDLQIRRLTRVRSLLERVPAGIWTEGSLHHLTTVLEAMQMGKDERERWLEENWSRTMLEEAPDAWRQTYLKQMRDILPDELTAEQAQAWTELQDLLADPKFKDRMQEAIRPFWQMIQRGSVQPDAWSGAMEDLMRRGKRLREEGADPSDPRVQALVGDWIATFANAAGMPQSAEFLERFVHYAEQVLQEPSRQLWGVMRRLRPDQLELDFEAQMLMIEGLRSRMAQGS